MNSFNNYYFLISLYNCLLFYTFILRITLEKLSWRNLNKCYKMCFLKIIINLILENNSKIKKKNASAILVLLITRLMLKAIGFYGRIISFCNVCYLKVNKKIQILF